MKKIVIGTLLLVLLAAGAWSGRRGYRGWKANRAMNNAREAAAKSNFEDATLWLRKALAADGRHVEAIRAMGDMAEAMQSASALGWRQRLVDVAPDSVTNRILLAKIALRHGDATTASRALRGVLPGATTSSDYFTMQAELARMTGKYAEAESAFLKALELEPDNLALQTSLAILRVQSTDPNQSSEARRTLEQLSTNSLVGATATRQLVLDALGRTNFTRALQVADQLVQNPKSRFGDHLLKLGILRDVGAGTFNSYLADCQKLASTNAIFAGQLGNYMLSTMSPGPVVDWLQTLPAVMRTNSPVNLALADAYMASSNWTTLHSTLANQRWGDLEYRRLAVCARALREQGLTTAAKAEWTKARKAADGKLDRLIGLQRGLVNWRWLPELEEILWDTVNRYPSEQDSAEMLAGLLQRQGNSRGLLTLYSQLSAARPSELNLKNNLASTALLLGAEEFHPKELALKVYEAQTNNPYYATTYAYSLLLQQKTNEAWKVMQAVNIQQVNDPAIYGYYGLVLAAAGEPQKAKPFLQKATPERLLPEEVKLFARVKLD
jgi:predicted Zn-dependent protease